MEPVVVQEAPASGFERYFGTVLDGLGDPRVTAVLSGPLSDEAAAFVRSSFLGSFAEAVSRLEEPFGGFPDGMDSSSDPVEDAIAFIDEHAAEHRQTVAVAMLIAIGDFVVANRARVIDAMKAAGEGPLDDRPGRMAAVASVISEVRGELPAIEDAADDVAAEAAMESLRSRIEPLRDELLSQVLDDAVVWGSRQEDPDEQRPGVPPLTAGGRRSDVEDLLVESWLLEMDMHLMLAARVGKPIEGNAVVADDQREFVLDALVAVQEAYTIRPDAAVLLKFGQLRLAKGDVGEARAAAEKVMEMVDDAESPIHAAAVELYDAVTEASPLTRRDRRCFVATAAMGDVDAPEVETLRAFRDAILIKSRPGRAFVQAYYRFSPPLADAIAASGVLRAAARNILIRPVAGLVSLFIRD